MIDKPNVHTDAPATLRAIAAPLLEMADRGAALVITCDTVAQMRAAAGALEWAALHITTGWPPAAPRLCVGDKVWLVNPENHLLDFDKPWAPLTITAIFHRNDDDHPYYTLREDGAEIGVDDFEPDMFTAKAPELQPSVVYEPYPGAFDAAPGPSGSQAPEPRKD